MISHKDFEDREIKYAPLNLNTVASDGIFEGYASLFNTIDMGNDSVAPGAFKKYLGRQSINRSGKNTSPFSVKMLYQHNPSEPIGIWEVIREDHKGLYVKGRLIPEIRRAKEVLALMKRGAIDGLSIGYKTIRSRQMNKGSVRQLLEVELYEVSVVTFPMHPGARVQAVKTLAITNGLPNIRDFERWLTRDAGFTRRQAQTAIAKGFKILVNKRDAEGREYQTEAISPVKTQAVLPEKLRRAAQYISSI